MIYGTFISIQNGGAPFLQEEKHIVEAWYVLHSMAAQMEYVIAFTSTLQDLTQLFIEMEKFKVKNDKYLATITKEEKPPTPIKERKKKEKERKKQEKLVKEMREKEKAKKINLLEKRKMTVNEEKSKEGHAGEEELWEEEFEKMDISDRTVPSKQTGFVPIEEFKVHVLQIIYLLFIIVWDKVSFRPQAKCISYQYYMYKFLYYFKIYYIHVYIQVVHRRKLCILSQNF